MAAPTSTIDLSVKSGDDIPIEIRSPREMTHIGDIQLVPDGSPVLNFAFDVTPAKYITAIITEVGIAYPPFEESLPELVARAEKERDGHA